MEILNYNQGFLAACALMAIVLLVWVQLSSKSELPSYDFLAGYLVHIWTYIAILLLLSAAATLVLDLKSCAVGFLTMSFLMTFLIVLQVIFLVVVKMLFAISQGVPLTKEYSAVQI